jgi:hypothetical protein
MRPKTFKQYVTLALSHQYQLKTEGKLPQVDLILRQDTSSQQHTPAALLSERELNSRPGQPRVGFDVVAKRTRRVPPENPSPAAKSVANEFMDRSIPTHLITVIFSHTLTYGQ